MPDFDDEVDKPWFEHGVRLEPEARGRYEWETGNSVDEVGIIVHPKYPFISCSPDGLVGDNGGIEIKSRISLKSHLDSQRRGLPSEHKPQVLSSLWITGREWWDFVSYFCNNGTTMIDIHRAEPDEEYFNKLETKCLKFWGEVKERVDEIRRK